MTFRTSKAKGPSPELIKRIIIYGILVLLITSAQCAFFSQLNICPATPDLVIGMVIAIAMLDSIRSAAVAGIAAGFVADAIGSAGNLSFSALFYLVSALILGTAASKMLPRFISFLLLFLPALALRAAYTTICIAVKIRALPSLSVVGSILLPELITTAILCAPMYFIVKLCIIPIKPRSRFNH